MKASFLPLYLSVSLFSIWTDTCTIRRKKFIWCSSENTSLVYLLKMDGKQTMKIFQYPWHVENQCLSTPDSSSAQSCTKHLWAPLSQMNSLFSFFPNRLLSSGHSYDELAILKKQFLKNYRLVLVGTNNKNAHIAHGNQELLFVLFLHWFGLVLVWDRVSLCFPSHLGTHSVNQNDLALICSVSNFTVFIGQGLNCPNFHMS